MCRLPLSTALAAAILAATSSHAEPFVFVSLPDTQIYAENRFPSTTRSPVITDPRGTGAIFFDQTEWIVENAERRGIRYVGHLGDIVQTGGNIEQWERAKDAMDLLLDADVPHGTVMGNHDSHGTDYTRNYLDYFGPQFFEGRPWYKGASPAEAANWQQLQHEGVKFGFLNFSINHPQSEIDWANQVLAANRDTIFIIGTHKYLYDFKLAGGRYCEEVTTFFGTVQFDCGANSNVVEPNTAEELFLEFVSQHPNILMIHAGHYHSEWLRLDGLNSNARTVIQILTDYQSTRNGGDGYLRLYELDVKAGTFRFETYSPTLDRMRTTIDHFVETIYLAYKERGRLMDVLDVSEEEYFGLLEGFFKETPAPDDFLLEHPDLDEPEERAYYDKYLDELFGGDPPEGFGNFLEWEGLWSIGFAKRPQNLSNFGDSTRSPSGLLEVDYADYFVPASTGVGPAFDAILAALEGLADGEMMFPFVRKLLERRVLAARRQSDRGRHTASGRLLAQSVLRHTDGCSDRGEPDIHRHGIDLVDDCAGQGRIHPAVVQAIEALASQRRPR